MTSSTCHYCQVPLRGPDHEHPSGDHARFCSRTCQSMSENGVGASLPVRLGVGILVAAQSMVLSLAINLSPPEPSTLHRLQAIVLVANLGVAILLGAPLAMEAIRALIHGKIQVELLFISGIVGSLGISIQSMNRGRGPIYTEVVAVLLVVYTLGRSVAARSKARAITSSLAWLDVPRTCRRVDASGAPVRVDVRSIRPGDLVLVSPGEILAIDGVIVSGSAFVREALLSGEAAPVVRRPGDHVWAGTACEDADIWIRAECEGDHRRVDRLIEAVDSARSQPGSLQRQADRLSGIFLPVVSMVALATFTGWSWHSGVDIGLFHALSVLLVACPCALGLATPVIVWTSLGKLAKRGLVARDGDLVERLSQVDTVFIDKTGTLTEGRLLVVDLVTSDDIPITRDELRGWLAALGRDDSHPVLRSFVGMSPIPEDFKILRRRVEAGSGVEALVQVGTNDPHMLRVGRREWVADVDESLAVNVVDENRQVFIAINDRLCGMVSLAETPRGSAAAGVAKLRSLGLHLDVLTGDTSAHSAQAGWPQAISNLSPEVKRQIVADCKAQGHLPLFVGDGLNDAPAIAEAFVSIAPASGSELATVIASATLFGDDLETLAWSIGFSRKVVQLVRRTILTAAVYNAIGMLIAVCGLLHPIMAAFLMVGSSLWVVSRVSRLEHEEGSSVLSRSLPVTSLWERSAGKVAEDRIELPAQARDHSLRAHATFHFLSLAVQGPLLGLLSGVGFLSGLDLTIASIVLAIVVVWLWIGWSSIPHVVDMAFGMATLGNTGMLLGWWVSGGFQPVSRCQCFSGSVAPGMWIGMITLGHVAMTRLGRDQQRPPMGWFELIAGHVGMVIGMAAGAVLAERMSWNLFGSDAAMLAGMVAGMQIAHPASLKCTECFIRV